MGQTLQQDFEIIVSNIQEIPDSRKYWMIRTQKGSLYDTFKKGNFVALEHEEVDVKTLLGLFNIYKKDEKNLQQAVKAIVQDKHKKDPIGSGLIAGQTTRFAFDVREGDIVVIPSEKSATVSFGEIKSSSLYEVSEQEIKQTRCTYILRKKVRWLDDIERAKLDPYLYRMFQAHQAINDISGYAEIIERSINNFFIRNDVGNLVLEVEAEGQISARQLFDTGHYLLQYVDNFVKTHKLDMTLDDVDVKINLNSPGKIHLKAPKASTVWLIAIITVGLVGGGFKVNYGGFNLDLSTNGVIQEVVNYQNSTQDRKIKDTLMHNFGSMHVKSPDDAIKVLKQFSVNKDLAK